MNFFFLLLLLVFFFLLEELLGVAYLDGDELFNICCIYIAIFILLSLLSSATMSRT